MDCPTCGLVNPPGALRCDCGYDFKARQPSGKLGQIDLSWPQRLAAYWSTFWPAWIASIIVLILLTGHTSVTFVVSGLVFLNVQAFLTHRLVRKNYRSFRVFVIRESGPPSRRFSRREAGLVWLWMVGPQLALYLFLWQVVWWFGAKAPPGLVDGIFSFSVWPQLLVVGPYGVGLALRAKYPGFRLQAHGLRYL
jgi:hypothetical protein